MSDTPTSIMTPVFSGTRYLHHVCSECSGEIKFEQAYNGGTYFYAISCGKCDQVRYCPLCGAEIIRFSDKPIYETPIDLKPLDIFAELRSEYVRKAKWLYHCYISEEHRDKIEALEPLIKKSEVSAYYLEALELAQTAKGWGISYQTRKKLRKEFGEEKE